MRLVKSLEITGPNQVLIQRANGSSFLFDLSCDEILVTDSRFVYRPMDGQINDNIDTFFRGVDGKLLSEWSTEEMETLKLLMSWSYYDPTGASDQGFMPSAEFMMGHRYYKETCGQRRRRLGEVSEDTCPATSSQVEALNRLQEGGIDWKRAGGELGAVLAARGGAHITAPAITGFTESQIQKFLLETQARNAASLTLPGASISGLAGTLSQLAGSPLMGAGLSMYTMQASLALGDFHRGTGTFSEPVDGTGVPVDRRLAELMTNEELVELEDDRDEEEDTSMALTIVRFEDSDYVFPANAAAMQNLEVGTLIYIHSLGRTEPIISREVIRGRMHYEINVPLQKSWTRWLSQLSSIGGSRENVFVPYSSLHPSNTEGTVILNALPWDWWGIAQTTMETVMIGLLTYGAEHHLGFGGIQFVTLAERITSGAMSTRWVTAGNRLAYAFQKLPKTAALTGGFKRHGLVQLTTNFGIVAHKYSLSYLTTAYSMYRLWNVASPRQLAIAVSSSLEGEPLDAGQVVEAVTEGAVEVYRGAKRTVKGFFNTGVGALALTIGVLVGLRLYKSTQ